MATGATNGQTLLRFPYSRVGLEHSERLVRRLLMVNAMGEGLTPMHRPEIVLAALAPARGGEFSPVQVQKLFFLIDREIAGLVDGPHFNFKPYDYGPFDKHVYHELDRLAVEGLVTISHGRWQSYRLTPAGQERGDTLLASLPATARKYIEEAAAFVRSLSFTELVSAIYKAYPEMRANSVFQG